LFIYLATYQHLLQYFKITSEVNTWNYLDTFLNFFAKCMYVIEIAVSHRTANAYTRAESRNVIDDFGQIEINVIIQNETKRTLFTMLAKKDDLIPEIRTLYLK